MRRMINVACAAAVAFLVFARPARADGPSLRMATLAPSGSKWTEVFDKGSAETAKKTQGRVNFKYYAGGEQGDEKDFIRKIKLGQLDGAAVTATGLAMIDKSIRVLELPMMFASTDELDYVADKMWPYFQKKFEKEGFRLNDRGEVGWIYFLSKDKVTKLDDLKSVKMWLWSDDELATAIFKKLGISGTPLGVPEVDGALTAGRINACYNSPLGAVALQWHTKVKYITSMPMSFAIGATVISLKALEKVSEADRKQVTIIGKNMGKRLREALRKENETAQKTMTRKGVETVPSPKEMVDAFQVQAEAIWKDMVGKLYTQEELNTVLKYRQEFRDKHK
jgi:TRAP-type transport system periplasmic protein